MAASAPAPGSPFVDHCLELLAPLGHARARRMFGGHGVYLDDLFVGIVAHEVLYLKVDGSTRDAFEAAGGRPFVHEGKGRPMTLGFWTPPGDALDAPAAMAPWARLAVAAAVRARSAAPRRPRAQAAPAERPKRRNGGRGAR